MYILSYPDPNGDDYELEWVDDYLEYFTCEYCKTKISREIFVNTSFTCPQCGAPYAKDFYHAD